MRTLLRTPGQFGSRLALLAVAFLSLPGCGASPAGSSGATTGAAAPSAGEPNGAARVAGRGVPISPEIIVAAPDRTPEDREADARRRPAALLEFIAVAEGERVADLGAGSGYTTELLARAVGPSGVVYAQNDRATLDNFVGESWPKRLEREATHNVVRMDREFEAPFSAEAHDLDLVTLMFSYHDVIANGLDRGKLNAAVLAALKPGGLYVVADHQAPPGSGTEAATRLHRIDEKLVRAEIEAAGFAFVESAAFLHDPKDTAGEPSFKLGFNTDRFVLKFKKPDAP